MSASPDYMTQMLSGLSGANDPSMINNALYSPLMGIAAGLLQAGGPSRMPVSLGQAIGAGLQGGQQFGTAGIQRQMQLLPLMQQRMLMQYYQNQQNQQQPSDLPPQATTPNDTTSPQTQDATSALAGSSPAPGLTAPTPTPPSVGLDPTQDPQYQRLSMLAAMTRSPQIQAQAAQRLQAIQASPQYQSQVAQAKSNLSVDFAQLRNATNPTERAFWQNKAYNDAGAIQHTFGGVTNLLTGNSTVFGHMPEGTIFQNGQIMMPPGGPQTIQTAEAAHAVGAAQGQLVPLYDNNGNVTGYRQKSTFMAPVTGVAPPAAASPQTSVQPPRVTPQSTAPQSPVMNPFSNRPMLGLPPLTPQANGSTLGISPGQRSFGSAMGKEAAEAYQDLQEKADTARQQETMVSYIDQASQQWSPGKFSSMKGQLFQNLYGLGLLPQGSADKLGSYEEASKLSINLQSALTKMLGSREAAQIFNKMGNAIPNLTLSAPGLAQVSKYYEGSADYIRAKLAAAAPYNDANNPVGVNAVENKFQTYSNPAFYIEAKGSPQELTQDLKAMGPTKAAQFLNDWKRSYQLGYAPAPPS